MKKPSVPDYLQGPAFDPSAELVRMADKFEPGDRVFFQVELYNLYVPSSRFPYNGYYVAEIFEGARSQQWGFKADESGARSFCQAMNEQAERTTGVSTEALRADRKARLLQS